MAAAAAVAVIAVVVVDMAVADMAVVVTGAMALPAFKSMP